MRVNTTTTTIENAGQQYKYSVLYNTVVVVKEEDQERKCYDFF